MRTSGGLENKFYAPSVGNVLTVDLTTGERVELVSITTGGEPAPWRARGYGCSVFSADDHGAQPRPFGIDVGTHDFVGDPVSRLLGAFAS